MSYDDYDDEYEYEDDDEYYDDDDEEYLDYSEDTGSSSKFGGSSSGLPGSSSSGSRFGGTSGSASSRFGSGGSSSSSGSSSRFGGSGSSSSGSSSRFGGGSKSDDKSSSGSSSRFGGSGSSSSGSSSRFGGGSKSDDKSSSSSSSRFGGSGSSSSGSSSRFGSGSKSDDKSSSSSSSRFGSGGSSSSSGSSSRFGGGSKSDDSSSSGSSSRFGGGSKTDDKSSSGSSSRFGSGGSSSSSGSSSRFGGGSKPADKKDDKSSSSSSSRFGSGGSKTDDKKDDKKDDKSSSGGRFGGITGRFGGGSKTDDKKDDKSSGGGRFGGITGRFGGGSKTDDKKDDKKDDKSSGGGRFGGITGRFGGGSKTDDKKDDKKDDKSSGGGRFGGITGRFGGGSKTDDKKDDKKDDKSSSGGRFGRSGGSKPADKTDNKPAAKQSAFGANKSNAKSNQSSKTAATTAKADSGGGVLGRITSAFSFGGNKDDKASTSKKPASRKVPKANTSDGLTLDNWLDIIGVGSVVISFVLFFSAISQEQAAISGVHTFLGQMFGWGSIAVPIALFVFGVWLIVRHFGEEAPTVDPIRVVGVLLVFISMLYFFQWYDSFSYANIMAEDGGTTRSLLRNELNRAWEFKRSGGGIIGAELYYLMVTTVTDIGGFLLMTFVSLIGIMFITRMTAAEILRAIAGITLAVRENMKQRAVQKRAERQIATQLAAQEQARLLADAGLTPQLQGATSAQSAPNTVPIEVNEAGREIRMTVGGHAETISMAGQQNGQPQVAYGAPVQMMPSQAPTQQNNNNGLLGRFGGSLFGRGNSNNNTTTVPLPPTSLPDVPLPMDDGYSHFDTGPSRPISTPETPKRMGELLGDKPADIPPATVKPVSPQPVANAQPEPSREAKVEQEVDEVNDFLKQRQDRLDKLRKGEIGPISQSAMARAKQDDVSSVLVPSNEGKREEEFNSQFATGIGEDVRSEASSSGNEDSQFIPPSKLPSAQADGDNSPKQEMLSVPVEKPKSSAVTSNIVRPDWRLPDYRTLLSSGSEQEFDREYLLKQARTIEETLEAFGAPGRVVEVNTGPVITQFGVEPDYVSGRNNRKQRVKVSAIAGLDKDLQLALGARSIRVEAPVPGKGYVGIEVPNAESTLVSLRDVMDSPSFSKHKTPLAIALGQSVSGAPISADLSTMPHLLVAGTTGSGKSVCVNSIIASIISKHTPDEVKFIMVDPKRVELTGYNGIPHLVAPVVVELERIVGVLKWVTREMDTRYKQFSEAGSRNIVDFNKNRDPNTTELMPYMVIIIDELADLMMLAPEETERSITRIAALARATGIHLVIATQRPSVDVVTGLIKANFPARIAFAVAGSVDSRVILDQPGAERLLGKGDMLYLSGDSPAPLRLQGVFVSDMEINNIVRYWKMQGLKHPDAPSTTSLSGFGSSAPKPIQTSSSNRNSNPLWTDDDAGDDLPLFASANRSSDDDELSRGELTGDVKEGNEDDLYDKSVELVRRLDKASISLLQRRLRIGYTRAARLIDVMEARGVVGPAKDGSSKPRDVLPE